MGNEMKQDEKTLENNQKKYKKPKEYNVETSKDISLKQNFEKKEKQKLEKKEKKSRDFLSFFKKENKTKQKEESDFKEDENITGGAPPSKELDKTKCIITETSTKPVEENSKFQDYSTIVDESYFISSMVAHQVHVSLAAKKIIETKSTEKFIVQSL